MKILHFTIGGLGLLAFVLTGQYMHWELNHLRGLADGPRMMYRTGHIYIMWSALLNLALAMHGALAAPRWARIGQNLASVAILVGPALLCLSFFTESASPGLWRGTARAAIYLSLAGVLLHAMIALMPQRPDSR